MRPPLLLVRHGSTPWTDPVRLYQGHIDVPLSDLGRAQAEELGATLREEGLTEVWHSPLSRAQETAERIATAAAVPCRPDRRLRELCFGTWEGRSHEEVRCEDPEAHARHYRDVFDGTPPGGEPVASLMKRLSDFLAERWVDGAAPVAAVTHEGVIRAAAVLLGLIPLEDFYAFRPPPGSVLEILPGSNGHALRGREFTPASPASPAAGGHGL